MTDDKCAREISCWDGQSRTFNLNNSWVRKVLSFRGIRDPHDTPVACLSRFDTGSYSIDDIERVIELGLIGGGMPERDVDTLLDAHVRQKPLAPNAMIAAEVLSALFVGDAK